MEEEGRVVGGGGVGGVGHLGAAAVAVDGFGGGRAAERGAGGLRFRDGDGGVIVAELILVLSRAAPEVGRVRRGARWNGSEIVG